MAGTSADPFGLLDVTTPLGADEPMRNSGRSGAYEGDSQEYLRGDTFNGMSDLLAGGPSSAEADVVAYLRQISRKNTRRQA